METLNGILVKLFHSAFTSFDLNLAEDILLSD